MDKCEADEHDWKTNMVDWDRKEPAKSETVEVVAYCEKCEMEVVFRYAFQEAETPRGDYLEGIEPCL